MKRAAIIMAAALTAGSVGYFIPSSPVLADPNTNTPTTMPGGMRSAYPPGAQPQVADADVRTFIGNVTADALTQHGMEHLCTNFSADDMHRISDSHGYSDNYGTDLDNKIDLIHHEWHRVYGVDFPGGISRNALDDRFAHVMRGTYGQDSTLAAQVCNCYAQTASAQSSPNQTSTTANQNGTNQNGSSTNGQTNMSTERTFPADEEIALVNIAANDNLPETKVPLVRKAGEMNWRLLTPQSTDAEQVRHRLSDELTSFSQNVDQWPADPDVAFRQLAHRVMMALTSTNSPA